MRIWAAVSFAGLVAVAVAACSQAHDQGTPPTAPTYACVSTFEGKTASCMQFTRPAGGPGVIARLKQGCLVVPGQTWGAACPTDGLAGCCTMRHPDRGDAATCFYKGGPLMATPEQCAKDGGVWSGAP